MADIFSTISLIAFVLAGIFVIAAIALFFALNTRAAYLELQGKPQKKWVSGNAGKSNKGTGTHAVKEQETPTTKIDGDDEAATTLDSGEAITTVSLMNVYEPGTEIMEEDTETVTEMETNPGLIHDFYEEDKKTSVEPQKKSEFKITKKKVIVHSDELLK